MEIFDIKKLQEEIDIYSSSLEDSTDCDYKMIECIRAAYKSIINSPDPRTTLEYINRFFNTGLLSPLSLHDDEFSFKGENYRDNKRYKYLIQNLDDYIIYLNAWKPYVVHVYNHKTNKEEPVFPTYIDVNINNSPLWITKGGCCNGDFIQDVFLKESTIEKHAFIPHSPIVIPVSIIIKGDDIIFTVDAREPKLKALQEFYDVKIRNNSNIKFDIRKYEKLNKYVKRKR